MCITASDDATLNDTGQILKTCVHACTSVRTLHTNCWTKAQAGCVYVCIHALHTTHFSLSLCPRHPVREVLEGK